MTCTSCNTAAVVIAGLCDPCNEAYCAAQPDPDAEYEADTLAAYATRYEQDEAAELAAAVRFN